MPLIVKLLIFMIISMLFLLGFGYPNSMPNNEFNSEQLKELNDDQKSIPFSHRDEDQPRSVLELDDRYKYDVEILDARDVTKDVDEVEERFRGTSLNVNRSTFVNENIETRENVNDNTKSANNSDLNHYVMGIVLVVLCLVFMLVYIVFILWRYYIQQRYRNRHLLVSNSDDYDGYVANTNISN